MSVSLTVALILNELSFTILIILAPLVIYAAVSDETKNPRLMQVISASHIALSIVLGSWLLSLLFHIDGTRFEGERSVAAGTIVLGWAVEIVEARTIVGALTINEYCKAVLVRPRRLEISEPIPVTVDYGHSVTQSDAPVTVQPQLRMTTTTPVVMDTPRVHSHAAVPAEWILESREEERATTTRF
ncbi:hypothetical protein B0H14DRAFT_2581455 [Mycena olivaceomarginata]|nr:hypothetical protein B0H14DRAFT_2581455 [Mycena olivaceomarginata]